ncbi:T-cell surface glycoprotein CD3 delta chain-like [Trichomycterus rosablanca]|uniref:T-cell surface glycoprotein CD3 delta chain-like n=1 Tax=Trichomycterus rosablanca TaxID=2290929 RepID=UPI002F35B09C
MKMKSLLLVFGFLLMVKFTVGKEEITVDDSSDKLKFTCDKGIWEINNEKTMELDSKDRSADIYTCVEGEKKQQLLVRIRTCENCIELDALTLSAIVIGNIVATVFIGVAIYSISSQPKAKIFPGNKASDRVNLISNGEGDTYQQLKGGDRDTYSRLGKARKQ